MKKVLTLALVLGLLLCSATLAQPGKGARPAGMGNAFIGLANDGFAASWNPGGLNLYTWHQLSLMYGGLYWGIDNDNLKEAYVGVTTHFLPQFSFGLDWEMVGSDIYTQHLFGFPIAYAPVYNPKEWIFSLGMRPRLVYDSYSWSAGHGLAANDPLLRDASKLMFDMDFGAAFAYKSKLRFGLSALNLISPNPNLGSSSTTGRAVFPRSIAGGVSYAFWDVLIPDVDFGVQLDGEKTTPFVNAGVEGWVAKDMFALRGGYSLQNNDLSAGLTFRLKKAIGFQIDYAFLLPLGEERAVGSTTHKFALSLLFDPAERKAGSAEDGDLDVSVECTPTELKLREVSSVIEEEPLVPIVFFEPKGRTVDPRFERTLSVIGERIARNPGVQLTLKGYVHTTDGMADSIATRDLAKARSEAVRSRVLDLGRSTPAQVLVQTSGYDPQLKRSGGSDVENSMIAEENRRVEMRLQVNSGIDLKVPFAPGETKLSGAGEDQIDAQLAKLRRFMEDNPDVDVIVEATGAADVEEKLFARAFAVREYLRGELGSKYADRVYALATPGAATEEVRLLISGEGMIYRPVEGVAAIKTITPESNMEAKIAIDFPNVAIKSHRVLVTDHHTGRIFTVLSEGPGAPKHDYVWNFKNKDGGYLDPTKGYLVRVELVGENGKKASAESDAITTTVTQREVRHETLIIVQFVFNDILSESKYLESRIEYIAQKVIQLAEEKPSHIQALVGGHTDIIGSKARNQELSDERSRHEEEALRRYLRYLLGLKSESELNTWLVAHKIELVSRGFAETKPYIINKVENGVLGEKLIGDNKYPEGRTINRRVVIEFDTEHVK